MSIFDIIENGFMPVYEKRNDQFYGQLFFKVRNLKLNLLGWILGLILLCCYVLPGVIYAIYVFIRKRNFSREEVSKIKPPFETGQHINYR